MTIIKKYIFFEGLVGFIIYVVLIFSFFPLVANPATQSQLNPIVPKPILTIPNIVFVILVLSTIFGVYHYFKKPQNVTETKIAVGEERDKNKATILAQTEAEGKALLLAQRVLTEKEYNTKQFDLTNERFDKTDNKIEILITSINKMNLDLSKELMRVTTIVEGHMKGIK